jgi:hypothetical protein
LDISNADFDTLLMTPGPRHAPPRRAPPRPANAPKPRGTQAHGPQPTPITTNTLTTQPAATPRENAKPARFQGLLRRHRSSRRSLQKSRTLLAEALADSPPTQQTFRALACAPSSGASASDQRDRGRCRLRMLAEVMGRRQPLALCAGCRSEDRWPRALGFAQKEASDAGRATPSIGRQARCRARFGVLVGPPENDGRDFREVLLL